MTRRAYREATELCEEVGLTVLSIDTGKHIKVRVRAKDGREAAFTFPITGSDRRGQHNQRAELRRFARGEGFRGARHTSNNQEPEK